MSEKEKGFGYIGKVGNGGSQYVEAPVKQPTEKPGTAKQTGEDLRSKK